MAAAEVLKERGAYKIYVLATHGLLSSDAPRLIDDSPIDEVSLLAQHTRFYEVISSKRIYFKLTFYFAYVTNPKFLKMYRKK